jgi:hypothetical protein
MGGSGNEQLSIRKWLPGIGEEAGVGGIHYTHTHYSRRE